MLIVPAAEATKDGGRQAPRVLLVDRQPLFLAALGRLLSPPPMNARVAGTTDSSEAMRTLERKQVDLLLSELTTSPVPATELFSCASSNGVPVVLLDVLDDPSALLSGLRSGAAGLFRKDAEPEEFLAGLQAVMAGHRALSSTLIEQLLESASPGLPVGKRGGDGLQLTPREGEVLRLLGHGKTVAEIADNRRISQKTVRKHLANVYRKLRVRGRSEALLWAARAGLVPN